MTYLLCVCAALAVVQTIGFHLWTARDDLVQFWGWSVPVLLIAATISWLLDMRYPHARI